MRLCGNLNASSQLEAASERARALWLLTVSCALVTQTRAALTGKISRRWPGGALQVD